MVSVTVTSQVTFFSSCHGMSVMPSDRLPSPLERPEGSSTEGIFALTKLRRTTSLSWWWRIAVAVPRLQDSPWVPRTSTSLPQGQWCGSHRLTPRQRPAAILIASLSSLRPHVASGSACNQSPLLGAETVRSLAVLKLSQKWDSTAAISATMTGLSQALCFPSDGAASALELKVVTMWSRGCPDVGRTSDGCCTGGETGEFVWPRPMPKRPPMPNVEHPARQCRPEG